MTVSQVTGVLIAVAFMAVFVGAFLLARRGRAARTPLLPGTGVFTAEALHRPPVEGRNLQPVEWQRFPVPGFAVLSDQPLDAAQRLTPAFVAAVTRVFPPQSRDDAPAGPFKDDRGRAWIGVCGDRIAVASRKRKAAELADIVALAEAGAALARA
jgi:hypothetical protein